jgi:hypothetical protein
MAAGQLTRSIRGGEAVSPSRDPSRSFDDGNLASERTMTHLCFAPIGARSALEIHRKRRLDLPDPKRLRYAS